MKTCRHCSNCDKEFIQNLASLEENLAAMKAEGHIYISYYHPTINEIRGGFWLCNSCKEPLIKNKTMKIRHLGCYVSWVNDKWRIIKDGNKKRISSKAKTA